MRAVNGKILKIVSALVSDKANGIFVGETSGEWGLCVCVCCVCVCDGGCVCRQLSS